MHRLFALASIVCVSILSNPVLGASTKLAVLPTQFDETSKGQVPKLFDDYLLAAVQNIGEYEVIGQDDINALVGFEKQKDLFGCDDTSCFADIGGALGVDKLIVVKIARLKDDWISTAKLMNIKQAKVEARVSQITAGDAKALLQDVSPMVAKLFGKAVPAASSSRAAPSPFSPSTGSMPARAAPTKSPEAYGRGSRIGGNVMLISGVILAAGGALLGTYGINQLNCSSPGSTDVFSTDPCDSQKTFGTLWAVYGAVGVTLGVVLEGVGSKLKANSIARQRLLNDSAKGSPSLRWLGWLLAAGAIAAPFIGLGTGDSDMALYAGWGGTIGSSLIFLIGAHAGVSAELASLPTPTLYYAREPSGRLVQGAGLRFAF